MKRELYDGQFRQFSEQCREAGIEPPSVKDQIPVLNEDTPSHTAKDYDWSYLLHTAWAARVLAQTKPKRHVDFGSYVYFAALCSAFVPNFEFYDLRGFGVSLSGLKTGITDLCRLQFANNSLESISCLHVFDHIGLARYGDTLDAAGHIKAALEMQRVLALDGQLLLVVPANGQPRINFNAHRIFRSPLAVAELFPSLRLADYAVLFNGETRNLLPPDGQDFTLCMRFTK